MMPSSQSEISRRYVDVFRRARTITFRHRRPDRHFASLVHPICPLFASRVPPLCNLSASYLRPFASNLHNNCVICASSAHHCPLSCAHRDSSDPLEGPTIHFRPVRASSLTLKSVISGRTPYAPFGAAKILKYFSFLYPAIWTMDPAGTMCIQK